MLAQEEKNYQHVALQKARGFLNSLPRRIHILGSTCRKNFRHLKYCQNLILPGLLIVENETGCESPRTLSVYPF